MVVKEMKSSSYGKGSYAINTVLENKREFCFFTNR